MCYSLWCNAPTMLPTCSLEAESWVHYTTSCNTQSSAPEDGLDRLPKHVELIGIINKPLLSHLVGVYIIHLNQRDPSVRRIAQSPEEKFMPQRSLVKLRRSRMVLLH